MTGKHQQNPIARRRLVTAALSAAILVGGGVAVTAIDLSGSSKVGDVQADTAVSVSTSASASPSAGPAQSASASPSSAAARTPEAASRGKTRTVSPTPTKTTAKVTSSGTCGASFYDEPQGTANGETFDPNALTAASKTLAFDTRVRVTSLDTGKSVVVRINDRGPYVSGRCLDLSRAAFDAIDDLGKGEVTVKYEILA
ncbi:septal ring lytic transglycosylase RlpA family protein [Hamadaea tsunoensis]|uniref:septal ring lytic transglycosylase RlpA family protein n=1 Tax=Hamadaea tsunoensis TaxID=53368 RepID=UPI00068755D5|nr:septal ring lytic transglycosylase RlpA family protein [Hamadaea tsunoensis]